MGKKSRRVLKLDDMKSADEIQTNRSSYTDEQAQQLGYPSAEVMRLSDRLFDLAAEWRGTQDAALIREYHLVLYKMVLKGYDVDELDIQAQLPLELMPELPPKEVLDTYREPAIESSS